MKNNNALEQIRTGIINYIGAAQAAVPFEGRAKNQVIVGLLADEILKIAQIQPSAPCDPYILIPLFKANIIFLKQQQNVLSLNLSDENKQKILQYEAMIEIFEQLIENNRGECNGV